MGIFKAAVTSAQDVFSEQWKEYFYCDSFPAGVIGMRGHKRVSRNGVNNNEDDNVITDGSIVVVHEGQIALAVQQGKAFACWSDSGEHIFHSMASSSIFEKGGIENLVHQIGSRIAFGGDVPLTQRIYYFSTLESIGISFTTPSQLPFTVVDQEYDLKTDLRISCTGSFTCRLVDPILFYNKVCGNFSDTYTYSRLQSQLKSEFLSTVQQAVGELADRKMTISALQGMIPDLNERIRELWKKDRGLDLVSLSLNLSAEGQDLERLQNIQLFSDPGAMAAELGSATSQAIRKAASSTTRKQEITHGFMINSDLQQQIGRAHV